MIVSTLAIIISFTPLFFITGMMGPYMAPMAANVPLTVTTSTLCALTIVPWLSYQLLKRSAGPRGRGDETGGRDVTAEMAGRAPGDAILDMHRRIENRNPLARGIHVEWAGEGEWQITLRVFRDLGIAFGAALLGMYILLTVQTGSFLVPLILLMAVPLTLLGIMPGFWLLNAITNRPIGGFENPVFFTATSMIGMIALGGIVLRNATVLIDFVRNALERGESLKESILQSGAVRLRPIVLTAMTTALGAWPITLDPVFSGLAWALIFGLFASTAFTLIVVPVAYYAFYRKKTPP